jgi:O-antigen/teichoic acid export membrane protein
MLPTRFNKKVLEVGATFFIGQSATQTLQLVCGFLLIHLMSKNDYADFTLAIAILGTAAALTDLGISQTLTGLIGKQITNSVKVGRYLSACRYYRNRLIVLGSLVLLFVFWGFSRKYAWSVGTVTFLWMSVCLTIFFQAQVSMYRPLLLLEKRLKDSYSCELLASASRLFSIVFFYLLGWLVAPLVVFLSCCREGFAALLYHRKTRDSTRKSGHLDDFNTEKKEILDQSLPRVPSLLFGSFSGQFVIFAMGILGSKEGLAEIGALSRVGMLFLILKGVGGNLVAPYFARLSTNLVRVKSMQVLALLGLFSFFVCLASKAFPELFLFILGEGYGHLKYEVFLVVCASLIRFTSMITFSICLARKYVYYWYSAVDIAPQIFVIAAFFLFVDLGNLVNLLYFSLSMSTAKLGSKAFILSVGIKREHAGTA